MKLGFVIYGSLDTVSGGYLYDRKLVEYLRAHGDTVEIISLPWRNYASHLTDNFRFRLPSNFDLLIQDELNHPSLITANADRQAYPIVSLVHHLRCSEFRPKWKNWFYRIIEKKYLQSVNGFIFNSKTTENVVTGLIENSIPSVVAYPPSDRFRNDAVTEEDIKARVKTRERRILFLGNVIYRKGLHTLIEGLSSVERESVSPYEVDVVGSLESEPDYAREMQEKTRLLGLKSNVFFHGALDNKPLVDRLKQAHVLVVPSSYEGFGIVYLEGMGFGLPAIGTTAGAAGEIITNGENGFLINPDDAETLARHLVTLEENQELLIQLSLNALKRYQSQPKWVETAGQIRDFLQKQMQSFSV